MILHLQIQFSQDVAKLLQKANELGYGVTLGEALRLQAQAEANAASGAGIEHSLHLEKLAIDINLFKEDVYITSEEGHTELGAWWKTLGPNHRWGGDFPKKDFNHYSISPDGIRG
jgi:hypothetical protein